MFQHMISNLPWLHVLVAAIAYFVLGAIWYGPLFSKAWIRGHKINVSDPDAKKGVAAIMIGSFVLFVLICAAQQILLHFAMARTVEMGVKWGLFVGFGYAVTTLSITSLYLKKPLSIHLIDGLYHVIGLTIASIIMAVWR